MRLYFFKRLFILAGVALLALPISVMATEPDEPLELPRDREKLDKIETESYRRGFYFNDLQKSVFSKISTLDCNQTKVVITSTCISEEDPYCFHQNVAFVAKSGHIKNVGYSQPYRLGDPPFIASAGCVKVKQQHYVVLNNTNFGLCADVCDWQDFFTNRGQYLGSTPGVKGLTSFSRKLISDQFFSRMMGGDWLEQVNGEITIDTHQMR